MSMQDPLADMFTRIRNGQMAEKESVTMPSSKVKTAIAKLLESEGYITSYSVTDEAKPNLNVVLKYFEGAPVIEKIDRFSRPGLRQYRPADDIPAVADGLGIAIVSTSQGLMTDRQARAANIGGEVLCKIF